jgi:hypothetical protein
MTTITLNVGLNTNTGETLTAMQVAHAIAKHTQTFAIVGIKQSATERTAIVTATGLTAQAVYELSIALRQDCIAVSPDNGKTGALIGPKSDAWGWSFNPEYFIAA